MGTVQNESITAVLLTAGVLFVLTYVVVALGRVPGLRLDRTGAAVVGAAFMVALTAGPTLLLTRRVKPEKVFLEVKRWACPSRSSPWVRAS